MKLIIAGGRNFSNYDLLCKEINKLIAGVNDVEIISGGAKGADLLGEQYASNKNLHVRLFPADWAQYGKSAGIKRNSEMAQYADHCICFWDGQSKGTEKMISLAKKEGLVVTVVRY